MKEPVFGFKGFDKDLKCRGKQYEIGREEVEGDADLCKKGLHFCESPIDCFEYYPPSDSRYCTVEANDVSGQSDDDSKRVSKKMRVTAEIGLKGIIEAGVKFILEKVDFANAKESNTGDQSAATNTGDRSAATNTGDQSAATNTGYRSAATVEGKNSVACALGYQCRAKGALGRGIVVVERDDSYNLICIKAEIVDGERIKADTFYGLENGEFKEVG